MHSDPLTYILGASILSGSIGFFGCALMVSHRIRRAEFEGWCRGVRCKDRDKDLHPEPGSANRPL